MNTADKIKVMQAYLAGETIQIFNKVTAEWEDWKGQSEPYWNWEAVGYRTKKRRFFVLECPDGTLEAHRVPPKGHAFSYLPGSKVYRVEEL